MVDKEPAPINAIPVDNSESKTSTNLGDRVMNVTSMLTNADKRKQFMTSEDMEPHRMLAILLGLTIVITIIVAIVF